MGGVTKRGAVQYGRVGIGTSTPSALFAINALNSSNQADNLFYVGSSTLNAFFVDNHGNTIMNGNVGIGTTDPSSNRLLVVQSATDNNVLNLKSSAASGFTEAAIQIAVTSAQATTWDFLEAYSSGTTDREFQLRGDGAILADGTITAVSSGTGNITGGSADLAEYYEVESEADFGDIVIVASAKVFERSKKPYAYDIAGVVSEKPGFAVALPDPDFFEPNPNIKPIALVGRVPLKVTTESGPIQIGDRITSSSLPGVGMKATKDGYTVGIALEPFDDSQCQISNVQCQINEQNPNVKVGKILVFVNLGYSKLDNDVSQIANGESQGWNIDQTTGKLITNLGLDLGGNSIQNVSAILSASGNWRIDENGRITAKEFCLDDVCIARDQLREILEKNQIGMPSTEPTATMTEVQ